MLLCVSFFLIASKDVASASTIYSNDFSSSVADWQTFQSGWVLGGGVYRGTNTAANLPVESVWANGYSLTDYTVSVDMNKDSTHSPSDSQLIFHYQDSANYGWCSLFQGQGPGFGNGTYLILQSSADGVLGHVSFAFQTGTTYRLTATVSGNNVSCQVVGHPETLLSSSLFTGPNQGTAGLRSTHIATSFDSFLIESVPTQVPEPCSMLLVATGVITPLYRRRQTK